MNDPHAALKARSKPLASPTAAPRKIEVSMSTDSAGRRRVVLQDLSYGQGIGWYPQKTLELDAEQADALRKALCCARQKAEFAPQNRRRTSGPAEIIPIVSVD